MNPVVPARESLWRRWVIRPVATQLTQGTSPRKIAQAIAFGVTIGIFPLLGTPTLLSLALGIPLKLNQPVLQVFRELSYPLQLATVPLFLCAGETLFGTPHTPISIPTMMRQFFTVPGQFIKDYGMLGFHAVVVWALLAPFLLALLYHGTLPLVRRIANTSPPARHAP